MPPKKKLIEVALPLEAINAESAREKSIRHGHPSTLHLWWARRPLATARAVIWSSLVDDPSSHPERFPTEEAQRQERERLFDILTRLSSGKTAMTRRFWRKQRLKSSNLPMAIRLRCSIPSREAARFRWRRKDWDWKPMRMT